MSLRCRLAELALHIANLIYFCAGVAILIVGAIGLGSPSTVTTALSYIPEIQLLTEIMYYPSVSLGPCIYLTCLGGLVVLLCFLGCGGTYKKHRHIIVIYGLITLLIMLFNIAVILFYVIDPYFIETTVEYQMDTTLKSSFQPVSISTSGGQLTLPTDTSASAWVQMQFQEGCCGVNGYQDYQSFTWNNSFPSLGITNALVPPSCCLEVVPDQVANFTTQFVNLTECMTSPPHYTNTQGCINYVMAEITRYNYVYSVVAAGMTALQAIIMCLTMWLAVLHFERRIDII